MYAIEVPYINLKQIYESGQVFRWIKANENKYIIPFKDKAIKVEQNKSTLLFDCSEQDFFETWWNYFDLMRDYSIPNNEIKKVDLDFKILANRGKGIHVLNQDLFEVIIASLFIDKPFRISEIMRTIAAKTGIKHEQSMKECGKVTWYEFPTPQLLLDNLSNLHEEEVEGRLDDIEEICLNIIEGWLDLELLKGMSFEDSKEYLLDFTEINFLMADYICLFGLHHLQSFPCDKFIISSLDKFGLNYEEFFAWFIEDNNVLVNNQGILRQYLWYNEMNPSKRIEVWMKQ